MVKGGWMDGVIWLQKMCASDAFPKPLYAFSIIANI